MEYNQLKLRILSLFDDAGALDSRDVLLEVQKTTKGRVLSEKAIDMALMRYWRQGLLDRTRKSRRFAYSLTQKGQARKNWLMLQKD